MRSERRRRRKVEALTREVETQNPLPSNPMDDQATWKDAVPFLDEALDRLSPQERKAILQRFYEEKKFREIAGENGQSEDACKKRVQRALQKLTHLLTSRGVTLSGTAVASLLGAEMARAAPAHLTAAIAPNALAASSSLPITTVFTNTIQTMSTIKSTSVTAAAIVALAAIPISQQVAEGTRLQSELQLVRTQPETPMATASGKGASRAQPSKATPARWSPRTADSLLDELTSPLDYERLAKQLMATANPRHTREDPWTCATVFSRLDRLSEEEFDEFLNVLTEYPAPDQHKKTAELVMRTLHPGMAESWQETLERVMARGKGGSGLASMAFWAREDPDAALAWYREKVASGEIFGKGIEAKFEKRTFEHLVTMLAASRPEEAMAMFRERPQELRSPNLADEITRNLTKGMIETGDDTHLRRMFELHDRSRVLQFALQEHAWSWKFGEGIAFVEQFVTDPGQRSDYIVEGVRGQDGIGRQGAALNWVRDNTPEAEAPELFRRLGASADIGYWIKKQKPGPARDHAWLGMVDRSIEAARFPTAFSRANNIRDEELRDATVQQLGREWLRNNEAEAIEGLPVEVLRQIQNQ